MPDDAELLKRYIDDRSNQAFGEIVRRHLNLVYFAALRRVNGDKHLAEDVTQLVFSKLASKAPSLRERASLTGWLYVTARLEAAQAMRAARRRRARELEAQAMHEILSEPEQDINWDSIRSVIDDILYALGERERELVLLRYFEERPFAEIGMIFGTSTDAARFKLDRILEKIRAGLAKRGIKSTSSALALALASQAGAAAPAGLATTVIGNAIASTAASGVAASGVLQFMSTSKLALGAAVVMGLLGIGFSVHENSVTRKNNAALAAANLDYERALAQAKALKIEADRMKMSLEALGRINPKYASQRTPNPLGGQSATIGSHGTSSSSPAPQVPVINRALSNNPDVRAALAGWMKGCYSVNYGPLFASMGLTAVQIDGVEDLMMGRDINMSGTWLTLRPEGETAADVEESVHDFLGDSNFQQLQQYQATEFVREVASGLAGNLYDTDTPLTPQQAEQLTQIFAQNSTAPKGSRPFPGTVDWDTALTQAQGVLSDAQLAALGNEVTVLTSQPGIWGAMNPISPGSLGRTAYPPPAFYASAGH